MSQYATAMQDHAEGHEHFGPSGHDIRQPVRVHAVRWPDPGGTGWEQARTMCGRPAAGMEKAVHTAPDPAAWHAPRWDLLKCGTCDEAVQAEAATAQR